ncbi:MAG: hypothetical protein P0107_09480, partial [Nitrosomonas sp.]|nr:hypothetical protein [Nitrosomonas sp.]
MSDLQISLVIIGAVIIVGVVIFNRIQLARYHRKVQNVFRHEHDDVLLNDERKSVFGNERIEPQFGDEAPSIPDAAADSANTPVDRQIADDQPAKEPGVQKKTAGIDSMINYIADIRASSSIPHEKLIDLLVEATTRYLSRQVDAGAVAPAESAMPLRCDPSMTTSEKVSVCSATIRPARA